jgi:4-phytase/acid phosphatase/peptide/nickel transport system substrate-binding protein
MVLERNPDYWIKGHPYLDRILLRPLPDSQTRFASLLAGETDVVYADEYEADNIARARKNPALTVHSYAGAGAGVAAFNTKLAPFDDTRVRRALVMALDRKKLSPALTDGLARPASNPYGDGSWIKCKDDGALPTDPAKARELIKEYGKPVEFKMLFTATPRGRAAAQVMQQMWKDVGARMEIEQVDQATIAPRGFRRQFQLIPWRIPDSADPGPQMFANFHSGSPVALANWEDPELDRLLEHQRSTADQARRVEDFCAVARLVNREAIWFWTFQSTYYAITKANVRSVPKLYSNVINVADAWLE